ncbi:MAG TPA: hypothetical protein VNQ90_01720 [Chthoniobacteraceae bacterium]|nr:hypothetical protein [Chthoniobacteraceae bacterium]
MDHPSFPSAFQCPLAVVACGVVAAFAALTPAPAQAQLYDFNTPGQLVDDFTRVPDSGNTLYWTQQATGGLNNSGWIVTNTGSGSNARYSEILDQGFAAGATPFTLSLHFKWQPNTLFVGDLLEIGIGRSTDPQAPFTPVSPGSGGPYPAAWQELQLGLGGVRDSANVGIPNTVRFYGSVLVDGVLTNFNPPSSGGPTATLVDGGWYFLKLDFAPTAAEDGYIVSLSLSQSSNTGVVSDDPLMTWTTTQINPKLLEGDLQFYLTGRNAPWSGIVGIDNIHVSPIPEPSVAWLAGGALLALFALQRRQTTNTGVNS